MLGRGSGLRRNLLAAEDCHSVLVFGPPGSFKTTGLVIPAVLEWHGPVLTTSVKPDVIRATRAHRQRRGKVVVVDPLGASGLPGAQWTPLATCGTWAGAQQMATSIAEAADFGHAVTSEHKYWRTLGTKLLAPLLFAAAQSGRTMTGVLGWIDLRDEDEVTPILLDAGVDGAINAWEASQARTDKARNSVYGTAEDLLAIYADERVQAFTEGHDLDVESFLSGDNTVYLYAPVHEQRRLRPLFETVTTQVVQAAQERAARSPGGLLEPRFLAALDEAGNVAALELLPEWATTGRGQGIQLLSVWQDQAQLAHRYGDRAATVLNGHRAKVFLSGLADVGALELGSKLIGERQVTSHGDGQSTRFRDGCSASTWTAPDGSSLLTLDAPSVWTAPDGSRPIVWMIKAHPTENRMPRQARESSGGWSTRWLPSTWWHRRVRQTTVSATSQSGTGTTLSSVAVWRHRRWRRRRARRSRRVCGEVEVETWDAIRARRNVRSYGKEAIAPEDLDRILEAARRTPSAGNQQAWDFVVCTDPEQLAQLARVWRSAGLSPARRRRSRSSPRTPVMPARAIWSSTTWARRP